MILSKIIYGGNNLFLKITSIENNISRSNRNTRLEKSELEKGDSVSQVFQEEIKISSNANLLTCENVNSIQNRVFVFFNPRPSALILGPQPPSRRPSGPKILQEKIYE